MSGGYRASCEVLAPLSTASLSYLGEAPLASSFLSLSHQCVFLFSVES